MSGHTRELPPQISPIREGIEILPNTPPLHNLRDASLTLLLKEPTKSQLPDNNGDNLLIHACSFVAGVALTLAGTYLFNNFTKEKPVNPSRHTFSAADIAQERPIRPIKYPPRLIYETPSSFSPELARNSRFMDWFLLRDYTVFEDPTSVTAIIPVYTSERLTPDDSNDNNRTGINYKERTVPATVVVVSRRDPPFEREWVMTKRPDGTIVFYSTRDKENKPLATIIHKP